MVDNSRRQPLNYTDLGQAHTECDRVKVLCWEQTIHPIMDSGVTVQHQN